MRKKRKLKKKVKLFFTFLVVLFLLLICGLLFSDKFMDKTTKENDKEQDVVLEKLGEYVITEKEVDLYFKDGDNYNSIGSVYSSVVLNIDNTTSEYFKVKSLDGEYYVKRDGLSNYLEEVVYDQRYKEYIVFNLNVNTYDKTNFYDEENNLVYSINDSFSLPVIIKDNDRYGVEFDSRLLYIKAEEASVVDSNNTDLKNISGIATLNYHAFYDDDNSDERSDCTTEICHSDTQFKTHLDLIKENGILTLKMNEVEMYIDGKIQLPKSVLITIDDGAKTKIAVDMLTEYQMYATIFMVTSWFDPENYYLTDFIELHSHSHNMHNVGDCSSGQGGGIQCLDKEVIQNDLKTSSERLGGSKYFCYPFYEYNEYSIEMLKEAGYTMAFVGESSRGDNLTKVGSDKFRLPRFVIVTYTTLNDLERYFNGMK